jgi:exoribonuclease R
MSMRWFILGSDRSEHGGLGSDPAGLGAVFDAVRADLAVPAEFPPEVMAEVAAAAGTPGLPARDETAVPFFTIDRPGSLDLDQAMLIERAGRGYRVRFAVADVQAFVRPGGALDRASLKRGQAVFAPDRCTPLYPEQLSQDAASLLPNQPRPAYVWDVQLAPDGEGTSAEVYRAMVSSKNRFDYAQVQGAVDRGTADERLVLLREVGERRIAMEWERGGASLPMPMEEVSVQEDGSYLLALGAPRSAQDWTVQISLMIGMAAAEMMLHAEVGILRTMPEPDHHVIQRFRRQARALGVNWPAETLYGELLRSLDRTNPAHLALMYEATWLFRGAGGGYCVFDGGLPELPTHAAVAAPYAHVTAPLRRVVDRVGLVVCESICRDVPVPDWARQGLPGLPAIMVASDDRAEAVERSCAAAVTAATLRQRVGETFDGSIVDVSTGGGLVQISDPPILAAVEGECVAGDEVTVELIEADVTRRNVLFQVVGG